MDGNGNSVIGYWYKAEGNLDTGHDETDDFGSDKIQSKPSIYMLKSTRRINLQITDIKTERLQDISEGDAIAERIENLLASATNTTTAYRNYIDKLANRMLLLITQ